MASGLLPKLSVATTAAVGLCIPTLSLPVPGLCVRTGAVAVAAPSPTCGSDLRECLRQSADTRQTTFGGRYVTAEDVARCMEAFNACAHGTAGSGSNPPGSTRAGSGTGKGLPAHLGIRMTGNGDASWDCRVSGDSLSCKGKLLAPFGSVDSYQETFTGALAGLTATGTFKGHQTGHAPADPSCHFEQDLSGPATYVFGHDGSVTIRQGPAQAQGTYNCGGPTSTTVDAWELQGTWTPRA